VGAGWSGSVGRTVEEERVYLVAVTGGIGSGKSTVSARFAERGCPVIDADRVAREVVEPGQPALTELAERFGEGVIRADGSLDRAAMASIVFADPEARAELERITHPRVAARMAERIADLDAEPGARHERVVVIDHPLLVETGQAGRFDAVVVVLAPDPVRLQRLADERGMDPDDVRARIAVQATDAQRRAVATHVVDNSGDLAGLLAQVDRIHADILERASRAAPS
jgi:dephospho-CoA kinase